jgi:hypothetical protein
MDKAQVLEIAQTAIKEFMKHYDRGVKEAFVVFGLVVLFLLFKIWKQSQKNEKFFAKIESLENQNKEILAHLKADQSRIDGQFKALQIDIEYLKKKE